MLEKTCSIREATDADLPALASLMVELGYPTTTADMQQRYAAFSKHPDYAAWVAVVNNEVVAMIGLIRLLYFEKNGVYVRIAALVTDSRFRKKGIGKLLMQKAEEWALSNNARHLLVNSGNRNERKDAHAFYQHLGFEPTTTGFVKTINTQ